MNHSHFKWIALAYLLVFSSIRAESPAEAEIVENDRFQDPEDIETNVGETKANPPSNRFKADSHVNETDELNRLTSLTVRLTKVGEGQGTGDGLISDDLPRGIESLDGIKGVDVISFVLSPKLGGTGSRDNLFAQNRKVNLEQWRSIDEKIGKLVDETGSALLIYFLDYDSKSTSTRPTRIAVSVLRDNLNDVTFKVNNPAALHSKKV